LYPQGTLRR